MAGNDIQQLTFGAGSSGLAPLSIAYSEPNLSPLITAIQQRMKNAQNARENEIALQTLASREQIAQQEMQLKRDEFNAEGPLRDAQIENYKALADYHKKMGTAQAGAIKSEWQYKASLVPQIADFNNEVSNMSQQYEIGSEDWYAAFGPITQKYAEVLAANPQPLTMWDNRAKAASGAIAQGQLRTASSLNSASDRYQVPVPALGELQEAVDGPQEKVEFTIPKNKWGGGGEKMMVGPNDVWDRNPDGSWYSYYSKDEPNWKNSQPVSLAKVRADPYRDSKYRAVTIQAPQVEPIVAASRALSGPLRGNGVAPQWAYSLRGRPGQQQQAQRWVRDPTTGQLVPAQPTP